MNAIPSDAAELDAAAVAAYLKRHPGFLGGYPELAAQLTLPREQGAVASLAGFQTQQLREKNTELEQRLVELTAIAADNQRLMERMHALTAALLRATTLEVVTRTVMARLSEDFHSEEVRLLLFGRYADLPRSPWLRQVGGGIDELPAFADLLRHNEPFCGRLASDKLAQLFGEEAPAIHSVALLPLGEAGLLAIGSRDGDHFQPGMGTLFLRMIATTITAALARARDLA